MQHDYKFDIPNGKGHIHYCISRWIADVLDNEGNIIDTRQFQQLDLAMDWVKGYNK